MIRNYFKRFVSFLFHEKTKFPNDIIFQISEGADLSNLKFVSRVYSSSSKPFLSLGSDCIASCQIVFEKDSGSISIGDRTFIGGGQLICIDQITIGNDVLISWGCTIMDNDAHSIDWENRKNDLIDWKKGIEENRVGHYKDWSNVKSTPINIKDKSWIGFNSIILKGVTIGEGAVVGAGSVVRNDVPDYSLVMGNPAKVVKKLR